MQRMGDVRRHKDHFARFDGLCIPGNRYFRLTVQDLHHGIKRCRVFTEAFTFIKSEKGEGPGLFFDERFADNGMVFINHMIRCLECV